MFPDRRAPVIPARHVLQAGLVLVAALACTEVLPPSPPPPEPVDRVALSPATFTLQVGGTQSMTAFAYSSAGVSLPGRPVTWSSVDPSVATINATTGMVTAVGRGSTVIQGVVEGRTGTAQVSVTVPNHALAVTAHSGAQITVTLGSGILYCNSLPGGPPVTCSYSVPQGTIVKAFVGQVGAGQSFSGWSGGGCGTTPSCQFTMSQAVTLVANQVAANPGTFNLQIQTLYLSQPVQRLDGGVELVAGRDAYLRVFAIANQERDLYSGPQPKVRVRLYHGATEVATWLLTKPTSWVGGWAAEWGEPNLDFSYNVLVPAALMVPGLRVLAEVDPEGQIAEQNEGDNRFPGSGTPLDANVRTLPQFQIRMVPVRQTATGQVGDVTAGNMVDYLHHIRKLLPIASYSVDVRAAYTTSAPILQADDGNGAWGIVLSEILALRNSTDQSPRYYFGVVKLPYTTAGTGGRGYIPSSPTSTAKAAIGHDNADGRSLNLAHELGHNFGRLHAPCGNAPGPDPAYPYSGGSTGAWGLDLEGVPPARKDPWSSRDFMGYCAASAWVSDYTWSAVFNWRLASPTGAPDGIASFAGEQDGLLVWGRSTPSGVVLEPAFRMVPVAAPATPNGAWKVDGFDTSGALLFSRPFEAAEVADLPGGIEHHFAMVLPLGAAVANRVTTLRVTGPGGTAVRQIAVGAGIPDSDPVLRASGAGRRRLTWDASRHPMAMVRDAATGEILSFARGGAIELWSGATNFDVQLSDGVRVVHRRLAVR